MTRLYKSEFKYFKLGERFSVKTWCWLDQHAWSNHDAMRLYRLKEIMVVSGPNSVNNTQVVIILFLNWIVPFQLLKTSCNVALNDNEELYFNITSSINVCISVFFNNLLKLFLIVSVIPGLNVYYFDPQSFNFRNIIKCLRFVR